MRYFLILLVLMLTACVNRSHMSYYRQTGVTPELLAMHRVGPPPAIPRLEHTYSVNARKVAFTYLKSG